MKRFCALAATSAALGFIVVGCGGSSGHSSGGFAATAPGSTATPTSGSTATPTSSTTPGSTATPTSSTATNPGTPATGGRLPIDTIFIIFKENHTFDNYFATFPGANGATSAKISTGATVPLTPSQNELDYPGSNGWDASHQDFNGGAMDQFDIAEGGKPSIFGITNIFGVPLPGHGPFETYAPANGVASGPVKYYWEIAQDGVLCDNYFTSVMGCSTPNHIFSFAAQAANLISNENLSTHDWTVLDANGNQVSHPGHFTSQEIPTTIANELEAKGLKWSYFAESQGMGAIGQLITQLEGNDASIRGLDVVANLPDFASRYDDQTPSLDTNLAAILATGDVGNVTYIKPAPFVCEHPAIGVVSLGVDWTRKVVNEIGNSPYWNHCAILITFDDYGGWYDHVAPPQVDKFGLGFRVPCIIVSPYAKKGFVDHTQYEHSSLCKLAETVFGLPAMTARDAASADMLDAFDFTQTPRPFTEFQH